MGNLGDKRTSNLDLPKETSAYTWSLDSADGLNAKMEARVEAVETALEESVKVSFIDDNNGNVIVSMRGLNFTDDGNGNIIMGVSL